jgi:hypothetical protein
MYNMAQGAHTTHPNLLSGREGNRLGAVERQGTIDVSMVTVSVTNDTEALSEPVAQANAGNNAVGLLSLSQSASPVFTPHFYQKLPHSLSHLLKELHFVDGTDVRFLCDFLLKVLKIRQVGHLADQAIYEIIYPYCQGDLLARATNTISSTERFETFHAWISDQFIP